jgi:hypothetical protein
MSYLKIITLIFIIPMALSLSGQTIQYDYDSNGNRIKRNIIVEEIQSNTVIFPVSNPKTLTPKFINDNFKNKDEEKSEMIKGSDSEKVLSEDNSIRVLIYPNPTKGYLKLEIINKPLESQDEIRLYDLNGTLLMVRKDYDSFSEIDINHLRDGLYVLRIRINAQLFDFKIIKKQ